MIHAGVGLGLGLRLFSVLHQELIICSMANTGSHDSCHRSHDSYHILCVGHTVHITGHMTYTIQYVWVIYIHVWRTLCMTRNYSVSFTSTLWLLDLIHLIKKGLVFSSLSIRETRDTCEARYHHIVKGNLFQYRQSPTHIHTHTHIYTHIHTHTHTHINTHTLPPPNTPSTLSQLTHLQRKSDRQTDRHTSAPGTAR